jgi:citrate synthase
MSEWVTATEAAERLGIQLPTLYAYVSRGLLLSHPIPGAHRGSRYRKADIDRLAGRSRGRAAAGAFTVVVDSALTLVEPAGRLSYRGWDAPTASREASFERVAEWLWTGVEAGEPPPWVSTPASLAAVSAATAGLPPTASLVDRMRVALAVIAATDPLRHDRRPEAVALVGRTLISTLVDGLPDRGAHDDAGTAIAARLWRKLSARRGTKAEVAALNAALVLLADHDLAASTFAARVAASTWADPYLCVQAGLAALGGPLHGAAADHTRALFDDVLAGRSAEEVVGERLRDPAGVPGVGHAVYERPDPRAGALLEVIAAANPPTAPWQAVQAIAAVIDDRDLPAVNVDFALAALCVCLDLGPGSGEAIFAVARTAGFLAHAIEEYPHRLRFRPRTAYFGPPPRV